MSSKEAFAEIREFIAEQARAALKSVADDAAEQIKDGYKNQVKVKDEAGNIISTIDPKTIADAISVTDAGTSILIYISGDAENDESLRQHALGLGTMAERNPFHAALFRLRNKAIVEKITGIKVD